MAEESRVRRTFLIGLRDAHALEHQAMAAFIEETQPLFVERHPAGRAAGA